MVMSVVLCTRFIAMCRKVLHAVWEKCLWPAPKTYSVAVVGSVETSVSSVLPISFCRFVVANMNAVRGVFVWGHSHKRCVYVGGPVSHSAHFGPLFGTLNALQGIPMYAAVTFV